MKHIFCILQGQNVQVTASKRWFLFFGPPCWRCHDLQRTVRHLFFLRFLFERFAGPDCLDFVVLGAHGNTKNTYAFPRTRPFRIENTHAFPRFWGVWLETHARFHVYFENTYPKTHLLTYLGNTKIIHTRFLVCLWSYCGNTYAFLVFSPYKTRNTYAFLVFLPEKAGNTNACLVTTPLLSHTPAKTLFCSSNPFRKNGRWLKSRVLRSNISGIKHLLKRPVLSSSKRKYGKDLQSCIDARFSEDCESSAIGDTPGSFWARNSRQMGLSHTLFKF